MFASRAGAAEYGLDLRFGTQAGMVHDLSDPVWVGGGRDDADCHARAI